MSGKELAKAVQSLDAAELMTEVELTLPEGLSWTQYERVGYVLGTLKRASSWWLGDWIMYGEATYGHKYAQAMAVTGLSEGHLRNCVSTCSRVPRSRRRADVPFSCHTEVASMTPREQRHWLARCAKENLTQRELREKIRAESDLLGRRQAPTPDKQTGGAVSIPIVADTTPSGLPMNYVVPGALVRRLIRDAIPGRDGYMRVPRDLIERLKPLVE